MPPLNHFSLYFTLRCQDKPFLYPQSSAWIFLPLYVLFHTEAGHFTKHDTNASWPRYLLLCKEDRLSLISG